MLRVALLRSNKSRFCLSQQCFESDCTLVNLVTVHSLNRCKFLFAQGEVASLGHLKARTADPSSLRERYLTQSRFFSKCLDTLQEISPICGSHCCLATLDLGRICDRSQMDLPWLTSSRQIRPTTLRVVPAGLIQNAPYFLNHRSVRESPPCASIHQEREVSLTVRIEKRTQVVARFPTSLQARVRQQKCDGLECPLRGTNQVASNLGNAARGQSASCTPLWR